MAAVTYLGFLEIGAQIEMPFAYDQSDLDLDKFCLKLSHQLAEVTAVSFFSLFRFLFVELCLFKQEKS